MLKFYIILGLVMSFYIVSVIADESINLKEYSIIKHSGGTDKCGCHFNRTTGEYHCHNRKQRGGACPP